MPLGLPELQSGRVREWGPVLYSLKQPSLLACGVLEPASVRRQLESQAPWTAEYSRHALSALR